MKKIKVGFIGCGNMGGALAHAVAKSGTVEMLVCDANQKAATPFAEAYGARVCTAADIAAEARYIFLGVKPQILDGVLFSLREVLAFRRDSVVLVSMAAGVNIASIAEMAGGEHPIIRIMPNTPVTVGEGLILWTTQDTTATEDIAPFMDMMQYAGKLDRLPEAYFDIGMALSGCGPAYVYLFAEALADGAVYGGLPREKAKLYAAKTLRGAAAMLEGGADPGVLKDAVCSPGGTTIAGVHALEEGGMRSAVMNAVIAAYEKAKHL